MRAAAYSPRDPEKPVKLTLRDGVGEWNADILDCPTPRLYGVGGAKDLKWVRGAQALEEEGKLLLASSEVELANDEEELSVFHQRVAIDPEGMDEGT